MSILVIIPVKYSFPEKVYNCIMNSSVKCDVIVVSGNKLICNDKRTNIIYVPPDLDKPKGFRMSTAINRGLETVDLNKYDWLVKLDDDVDFQPDFIERNIKAGYDLMGRGMALIIKMEKFIDLMSGEFYVCCTEDTYLFTKFRVNDAKVLEWKWFYNPLNHDRECVATDEEYFLVGFDSGRMKAPCRKRFYKRPLKQLFGWIIGRYIYPYKLPVFYEKSRYSYV